jgi:filamentous hemagglutinin family protein
MGGGSSTGGGGSLQNAGAASASLTATRARDILKKTDSQVAAMKALQSSARSMMQPTAYNGLDPGGLVRSAAAWSGANDPTVTMQNGLVLVDIKQTKQNAYLYWDKFNVGSQTRLNFDQSAGGENVGNWIAFNKVMGAVDPSHIYGSITAQGQVYILNQNGIIFHNGSQVNTRSLVASTLPINENLAGDSLKKITARGLANNPDYQFLFSSLPIAGAKDGSTKGFTPDPAPAGGVGDVIVERGATISSPSDVTHSGGLVALVAPNVRNEGTISAPNGQAVLAAGLQVGLYPHSKEDPSLRGLDVSVGKIADPGVKTISQTTGTAQNSGLIKMMEGNATIAGKAVNQLGVIESSTSVSLNGRIDLMANYNAVINPDYKPDGTAGKPILNKDTGDIVIGDGSLMRILPEWSSDKKITGVELALNSVISMTGKNIRIGKGAVLQAPGATTTAGALSQLGTILDAGISVDAGEWFDSGIKQPVFSYQSGAITLDQGSVIDVAGSTGVAVDSQDNFLSVQLRGSELANSPFQRKSAIRGKTLLLDARITGTYNGQYWVGTPLGDVTGYLGLIEKTVSQLTTKGGTVSLRAGDSVSLSQGSSVDVSGGWVNYSGGKFLKSKLLYQGHLVDLSVATPDRQYDGVMKTGDANFFGKTYKDVGASTTEVSDKWGTVKIYKSPLDPSLKANAPYEAPYIAGADGGSIRLQAPAISIDGELKGITVAGPRQVRSSPIMSTLPVFSALSLNLYGESLQNSTSLVRVSRNPVAWELSPSLVAGSGFGRLSVLNHDGSIFLGAGQTLDMGVNGSINLEAATIDIEGKILAPGGTISLVADLTPYSLLNTDFSKINPRTEPILDVLLSKSDGIVAQYGASDGIFTQVLLPNGTIKTLANADLEHFQSGIVTIGAGAEINTAGILASDMPDSSARYKPFVKDGGSISISGYETKLLTGGVLNVSGGALFSPTRGVIYGNAGSLALSGGVDPGGQGSAFRDIHNGSLQLGSTMKGYAGLGATPGTLSISTTAISIGGAPSEGILNLSPTFFSTGGFGTFNLTGVGREIMGSEDFVPGIYVAPGTVIHPVVDSFLAASPSGQIHPISITQPDYLRPASTINLKATGLKDGDLSGAAKELIVRGDLVIGQGSQLTLDPQITRIGGIASAKAGSITLSGMTVFIDGTINAPGGRISISGAGKFPSNLPNPSSPFVTVDLGPNAILNSQGIALLIHDPMSLRGRFGTVLDGGNITVTGNVLAEAGSRLDVSGANGIYDLFPWELGLVRSKAARDQMGVTMIPHRIDSAGGSIVLKGSEMLYSDATLVGRSGGDSAQGGSLSISSGAFASSITDFNLAVTQDGSSIPSGFKKLGTSAVGQEIAPSGGITSGGGHIAVSSFDSGGFDSLTLGGNVRFNGPVTISLPGSLRVANGGVLGADSKVNLSASYVALGTPFRPPLTSSDVARTTIFGTTTDLIFAPPSFGTGELIVTARLIDIGNLSLQNIGSAKLSARRAIRGDGTFDIAGNLVMSAPLVYPVSGVSFSVAAYNHDAVTGAAVSSGGIGGSISIDKGNSGTPSLPLSASGVLALYAETISQGGNLMAPFGQIALGADQKSLPKDPLSGLLVPTAQSVILKAGSITSVSGVDPKTGSGISVPFGTSSDGTTWIDPSGTDITTLGLPGKSITLASKNLVTESGSVLDLSGGGNVTAQRWVSGLGGTINWLGAPTGDWLPTISYSAGDIVNFEGSTWSARQANSGKKPSIGMMWSKIPQSYAIIPGYAYDYAPTGYGDGNTVLGSKLTLNFGAGDLPAGTYTLLPASYATQPGAYLVTPSTSIIKQAGAFTKPDGSVLTWGTLFNGMDSAIANPSLPTFFQIFSPSKIAARVKYDTFEASTFFSGSGNSARPIDAGKLVFKADTALLLNGGVRGSGAAGGRGATIDISVPLDIRISKNGTAANGVISLSSDTLNSWDYGSLLVGGFRGISDASGRTPITVTSGVIDVSDAALSGPDIILAGTKAVNVTSSSLTSSGSSIAPNEKILVTGSGALVRVSGDESTSIDRANAGSEGRVQLDSGSSLSGKSVTLDASSTGSVIHGSLDSKVITINAGVISIGLSGTQDVLLSGVTLNGLEGASVLSLKSYTSMDFYGSGSFGSPQIAQLNLEASEILGFGLEGAGVDINADAISLKGSATPGTAAPVDPSEVPGTLAFNAATISFGGNSLAIDQFAHVSLNASGEVVATGSGVLMAGTSDHPTDLSIQTPLITGTARSVNAINASGVLSLQAPDTDSGTTPVTSPGLGAQLTLSGSMVWLDTLIELPSGSVEINATGAGGGDLIVGNQGNAKIDVSGRNKTFVDVTKYTDAGTISLSSASGDVLLRSTSILNLSADPGGGSAGKLSVSAVAGDFIIDPDATISAIGVNGGDYGSFVLDVGSLPSLDAITKSLGDAGFTKSLAFRVRSGNVTIESPDEHNKVKAHSFTLSADAGSIYVDATGVIDASGMAINDDYKDGIYKDGIRTGGNISLIASGSVILNAGSDLNVEADNYDAAGKGGSVFLSAGNQINGLIDPNAEISLEGGSIELDAKKKPSGTLHLRAPRTSDGSDIRVNNLYSVISGASLIAVEGYSTYDLTGTSGEITSALQNQIADDMTSFYGAAGADSTVAAAIRSRLAHNLDLTTADILHLAPGVEIINQTGGITLSSDWDLSSLRVGAFGAPGFLTLRAAGDITFNGSLSDGFTSSSYNANLLDAKSPLPRNFQSFSYAITAGSDFAAANAESLLQGANANIVIGVKGVGQNISRNGGVNALTADVISGNYQVIRTGSGDISMASSGDVQFWNQFASVYTAGVLVDDPTLGGTFDTPVPYLADQNSAALKSILGVAQQSPPYKAQFSDGGGNIRMNAAGDITHLTMDSQGKTVADSVRELPSSWLYRRGSVDAVTGLFEEMPTPAHDVASTAWWVDFSNFYEGVGALGGGNIIMNAGGNIANVDAVMPTGFRMPGKDSSGKKIKASDAVGVELGGGNLNVTAANNIDAGVYYVERGSGTLKAGGSILSNPTRDSQLPSLINPNVTASDANAYLPTTLFVGKGNFDVRAGGDLLLGPVANVFLTPQGINNSFWYKDYFSTFAPTASVNVESLGGNVTLRQSAVTPVFQAPTPMLELWMDGFTKPIDNSRISYYQPWLRTLEPNVTDLGALFSLQPPTLNVTSFSGDLTMQGNLTAAPSSSGNLLLFASGSIKGMSQAGLFSGQQIWTASQINLSDADPAGLAGISTPLSQLATLSGANRTSAAANAAKSDLASGITDLFAESGSFTGEHGSLQSKQQLHDSQLLHSGDTEALRLYALEGSISGLTLFSPKKSQISAAGDITDIGFYLQNLSPSDISYISSGGTITAYDPLSPLQSLANSDNVNNLKIPLQSGDIQGNGPGTFEILAAKNIDLGNGPNNADGTGVGITSIGNARNPALPFNGADIVVAAGLNLPSGLLSPGGLGLENFVNTILAGPSGKRYLSELAETMTYSGTQPLQPVTLESFSPDSTLTPEQQALLELQLFTIALRDNGRDYNDETATDYKSYASGRDAIKALFTESSAAGSVTTWSRDIRTKNQGNISIIAPGGGLTLANTAVGSTLAPAGIVTEHGGGINIYTQQNVDIGIGRIFTLRGGDIMIWSDKGDIAAGSSAKTVASAPPTRVLIDPQSLNVLTDLAGLATGGGIGVLATVEGVPPGNVDLIAPDGVIDAGDAGIRSSGNLNLAATKILNADNIAASGSTAGAPPAAPPPAAPNVSGATAASTASAANNAAAQQVAKQAEQQADDSPSLFDIEVLGYGGGEGEEGTDDQKKASAGDTPPPQASL